jgi:hypothetical protein
LAKRVQLRGETAPRWRCVRLRLGCGMAAYRYLCEVECEVSEKEADGDRGSGMALSTVFGILRNRGC